MSRSPVPSEDGITVRRLIVLCLALAAIRLISLPLYPLVDRTESRYAEIARVMATEGDWITPHSNGEPFWAKPPLSTWCQAASVQVLGVNEFAVRFPAWLATLLTAFLVWRMALLWLGRREAWMAAGVFAAAPLGLGMAGAVMTDPYLGLGLTVSLYALVRWCTGDTTAPRPGWSIALLYGGGLAIGTLAKGPIAIVLGGAPLLALCLTRRGRSALGGWPWLRAVFVFLVLAVPWFLAAEARTPGFLEYFFVGEHWHRFTQSDWTGDRYGNPHDAARGTILVYFAIGFVPWLPGVAAAWFTRKRRTSAGYAVTLVLWVSLLTPLVLFTLARSVLPPYAYPVLPAACILLGRTLLVRNTVIAVASITVICFAMLVALPLQSEDTWAQHSHGPLLEDLDADRIVYCRLIDTLYSAQFYGGDRVISITRITAADLDAIRAAPDRARFITKDRELAGVPDDMKARLVVERVVGDHAIWRFGR